MPAYDIGLEANFCSRRLGNAEYKKRYIEQFQIAVNLLLKIDLYSRSFVLRAFSGGKTCKQINFTQKKLIFAAIKNATYEAYQRVIFFTDWGNDDLHGLQPKVQC